MFFQSEKRPKNQPHFSLLKRINTHVSGDVNDIGDALLGRKFKLQNADPHF